jgi:hypothetical protein
MSNERVLISKAGSGIRKMRNVEGKTLGVKNKAEVQDLEIFDEGTSDKLGSVKVFTGADRLFAALDSGLCDVIITDSLAVEHYYDK